ncbi:glycosyltransferase [Rhodovulum sp. 12E13]|uniref:glycosyltransferase family 2 protein n=1 Tax=Rhodovulum sp. 12E13 TaxID=2203891 RepID=UPI000E140F1E|nr:glycosyltransferase [Rhodovulum sp. 12E13]RDC71779.1 glycosyltransferase [Rhodovulum sp. 12E13]
MAQDPKSVVMSEAQPVVTGGLTWGLCVATLDRPQVLELCVQHALEQSRLPCEIVIVDASVAWQQTKDRIAALVRPRGIPLHYIEAPKRSSAAQRNAAIRLAQADILFLIDDDSFLFPDCAARLLAAYESDPTASIAAIAATSETQATALMIRTSSPTEGGALHSKRQAKQNWQQSAIARSRLGQWLRREVLMMSIDRMFVPYTDRQPRHHVPKNAAATDAALKPTNQIGGAVMTVRRDVALKEPFEDSLLSYSPTEDIEASYRFQRHGALMRHPGARLFHLEAAAGREKRRKTAELTAMNWAFFIRRHSVDPVRDRRSYYRFLVRKIFAEFLKDGLAGRFAFPQALGMVHGAVAAPAIFRHGDDGLDAFFAELQKEVLR